LTRWVIKKPNVIVTTINPPTSYKNFIMLYDVLEFTSESWLKLISQPVNCQSVRLLLNYS